MSDNNKKNPFMDASKREKRLKLFLWGKTGTGKTILSLQFPSPVVLDLEAGTDLYGNDFSFAVKKPKSIDDINNCVDWLLSNKHDYKTLVLDPATIYWQMLQDKWSKIFLARNKQGRGFKFDYYDLQFRDWKVIKADNNNFLHKLTLLDMNIIFTAHSKDQYADGGEMKKIGITYDGEKNLEYFFDTVVQTYREGEKFMGQRMKDRNNVLVDEHFELSYDVFKNGMGNVIEKPVESILMINKEQIDIITNHIADLELPVGRITKMLDKYEVENIDDLTQDNANEIITGMEVALKKKEEKDAKS